MKKTKKETKKSDKLTVSGKRKTSIAKATIYPGEGMVRINHKPLDIFPTFQKLNLLEPIRIAQDILKEFKFNIDVVVKGGGSESSVEASRLAIARALVEFTGNQDLRNAYLNYDRSLLVADVRRKEQRKPNDSRARAARQKSYR